MKALAVLSSLIMSMATLSGVQAAAMGEPGILARAECRNAKRGVDDWDATSINHTDAISKRAWDGVSHCRCLHPSVTFVCPTISETNSLARPNRRPAITVHRLAPTHGERAT